MGTWLVATSIDTRADLNHQRTMTDYESKAEYISQYLCPPLKKEGHIALHMSFGMSVSFNLVQLITQECFAPEASNLVGR